MEVKEWILDYIGNKSNDEIIVTMSERLQSLKIQRQGEGISSYSINHWKRLLRGKTVQPKSRIDED